MQKRRDFIILMDGKDLDISSERRNNSPEPLNSLEQDKLDMQRNICLAFSYQEIKLKLWNLTKLMATVSGTMPQWLNWTP